MTRKQLMIALMRIREEMSNIARLEEELARKGFLSRGEKKKARAAAFPSGDSFTLRAVGSVLHDIYVACENIFEVVARDLDENLPSDPGWHRSLLQQMTLSIPGVRPALLSKDTAARLDRLRAFRHVFRNVYGSNLDSDRLQELLRHLPQTLANLRTDVEAFIAEMEATMAET